MSELYSPPAVDLVLWSGNTEQIATRLGCKEADLVRHLRRVARKERGGRITIDLHLANSAPVFAALKRRIDPPPEGW